MREKEKTLQSVLSDPKADGKKTQGVLLVAFSCFLLSELLLRSLFCPYPNLQAQTKFDTAKKEYEEYHVETSRLLAVSSLSFFHQTHCS